MNTRYTPVHGKLWHKDFIILIISELFLTISVYMQLPVFSQFLIKYGIFSVYETGLAIGVYGVGLFVLGPFCAWLTQRYRRNRVFLFSTVGMAIVFSFISMYGNTDIIGHPRIVVLLASLLFGAFYGLSKRILTGILLIDKSESFLRTKANCCAAWSSRFALAIGPASSLLFLTYSNNIDIRTIIFAIILISIFLVSSVKFPFKTPDEDIDIVSYDRFFLLEGWKYFFIMALIYVLIGLMVTLRQNTTLFYVMFIPGFIVAMQTETLFGEKKKGKIQETIVCILFMCLSIYILFDSEDGETIYYLSPFFMGMALEYAGSYILMLFVGASKHCQRSTAISSYFLACESGLAFGMCLGYIWFDMREKILILVASVIFVLAVSLCRKISVSCDK